MIRVAIPTTGDDEFKSLKKIIYSGKFVSGKNVEIFEKNFSKFIGTKYAIAVNSGTAALHAALASLGLKKDDEVIVPAISFVSSATAILHQGCKPVFCDVDLENYCMCPVSLEKKISKKTKAIIPVHFAGSSCEMKKIIKISKKYNIPLIEDCAQAHGTKYHGKMVGSFGKIACFSFYATKHMTTGEGGILCTDDKKVHDFCKSFRNHGMIDRDTHFRLGYNFRMSELNAAIGNLQLKKLRKMNSLRVKNSKYILKNLAKKQNQRSWFKIQEPLEHIYHTYFWCPIRIVSKKISIDEVKKNFCTKALRFALDINIHCIVKKYFRILFQKKNKILNLKTRKLSQVKFLDYRIITG